jgi:hypothetical protein
MQTYAGLRSLLVAAEPEVAATATAPPRRRVEATSRWRRAIQVMSRVVTFPVPTGWAAAAAAALVVVTWMVAPGTGIDGIGRPSSQLKTRTAPMQVSGTVEGIVDLPLGRERTRVVTVVGTTGVLYVVLLPVPVDVKAGDAVRVEGTFSATQDARRYVGTGSIAPRASP